MWQDNVVALAIENSDITLANSASETLIVRAVFGGTTASTRESNDNFIFAVEDGTTAAVNNAGLVTANASGSGANIISATLSGSRDIVAYATVHVGQVS